MKSLFTLIFFSCLVVVLPVQASDFSLSSSQLSAGSILNKKQVFNGFGCTGKNISPDLSWKHAPKGTKSFALTVYDPDAPTGSGWWHWVMFNIPANTHHLKLNAGNLALNLAPKGAVQSRTDYGKAGYGGPCPPAGAKPHHYHFTLYALKINKLPLDKNATAALVGYYLHQNMIKKASITALYGR